MEPNWHRYQLMHGELDGKPYYSVLDIEIEIIIAEDHDPEKLLLFIEQREQDDKMFLWKTNLPN